MSTMHLRLSGLRTYTAGWNTAFQVSSTADPWASLDKSPKGADKLNPKKNPAIF